MITIPGYRIESELGIGGQARVYLATQESINRRVAIKVLLDQYADDAEFAERFLREARTVANLSHPNIIPVYDFGQGEGTYFMVMEYLPGGNLSDRIGTDLDEESILTITAQLAEALNQAHRKGYVHRDVKPGNIMFREDGSAVLTDFGIARMQSGANQMTMAGQVLGTPKFMSPEQLRDRKLDGRSDLYSLGILFHLMLTGKVPYDHQDFMTVAMMHCKDPIPNLPKGVRQYQHLFERMVAKDPEHRFASGEELGRVLRELASGRRSPEHLDSASAARLKKKAHFQGQDPAEGPSLPAQDLPWETAVALQDMDPVVTPNWQRKAVRILKSLNKDKRRYVLAHHLEPKGIYLDQTTRQLVFAGRPGVTEIKSQLTSSRIHQVVNRLEKALEMLHGTREATDVADLMESSVDLVDRFDPGQDLKAQKEKMQLRQALLDDMASIVNHSKLTVPDNRRGLTEHAVRTFLVQVYIKQQMHGYRFKTYPVAQLEKSDYAFLRDVVAAEARTRQCELVHTDHYIFVVAPTNDFTQNPYSARRFLHEESMLQGKAVYFSGLAVPYASLNKDEVREHIQWSLTRIVTLERKLSAGLTELVREMEDVREHHITPLLNKQIATDGRRLEDAIARLLTDCERQLCSRVMAKLPRAVNELAQTEDDYEYLFHTWRSLLIQLGCDIRDFTSQFAATVSPTAEELDKKLMAYLALLDKNKDTLFHPGTRVQDDPDKDPHTPIREFRNVLDRYEPEVKRLQGKWKEALSHQNENRGAVQSLLDKVTKRDRKRTTPEAVEKEIVDIRKRALIELIRVCKRYSRTTVFLEFEGLSEVDDRVRHYALPAGELGLGDLPRLVTLYEDPADFDFSEVREKLAATPSEMSQRWDEVNVA